jgi:hypothetical protein
MDETIQRYLDRNKLLEDIEIMNAAYEASIHSAVKLEASMRTALEMSYQVSDEWQRAMEMAYYRAFRAAMSRGIKGAMSKPLH